MSPMLKWGLYVVLVGSTLATLLIATQSLGSLFGIYVIKKVKPNGGMPAPPCSENSLCAKAHQALLLRLSDDELCQGARQNGRSEAQGGGGLLMRLGTAP